VANGGPGLAKDVVVSLRNLSGKGLFIEKGRRTIKEMATGGQAEVSLVFRLLKDFAKKKIKLELGVYDARVRFGFDDRLRIDLSRRIASVKGQMVPPTISMKQLPLTTREGFVEIQGSVRHAKSVRDIYMFTANTESKQPREKVFYAPGPAGANRFEFKAKARLLPGLNTILVVARVSKYLLSYRLLKVLKEPLAPLTKKTDGHAPARR
jgi:hypothetical protein